MVVGIPEAESSQRGAKILGEVANNDFSWVGDRTLQVNSEPSVTAPDGLTVHIENIADMSYPTEYGVDKTGRVHASNFRTKKVGVQIEATPKVLPGNSVSYDLRCTITSFAGWTRTSTSIRQPVFNVRRLTTQRVVINGTSDFLWVGPDLAGRFDPADHETKQMREALVITLRRIQAGSDSR